MSRSPTEITVTVQRRFVTGEVPINVFDVFVKCLYDDETTSMWPECFGSRAQLKDFMHGMSIALTVTGYVGASVLKWEIPENWHLPAGLRFKITRDGYHRPEELDLEGNVIGVS